MLHHTGTTCSSLSPATIIWKMGKLIATLTWTWTEGGKWNSWYLNNFMIFFWFSWENDWENWKSFLEWQKILKTWKCCFNLCMVIASFVLLGISLITPREHLHARANPPLLGLNLPDAQMQFDNCSLSASPHPIFSNIFGYIDISDII